MAGARLPEIVGVLDALDCAVVLSAPDGTLLASNELARTLLGLPDAAGGARVEQVLGQRFTRAGSGEPQRLETTPYPRRVFEYRTQAVKAGDGAPAGTLHKFRDVTEQVRAEERFQREEARHRRQIETLEGRLEQIERLKVELTANVTHDLRTPLASIKAAVSGLLAGDVAYDPDSMRETLTLIEEETDRLQRRVQNLLSMASMESGNATLRRDWVDLADVTGSALESLRSVRVGREIRLDFANDLPMVLADYDQLQIAIRNLVENALIYSPADTPVEVSAGVGLGQVRVRVRDYGPGLMPDEFERIFDKFYRGRAARRIPGTGIGLPICRGICEAHGGRLWAEHAPGGGVAFVISLPLDESPPELESV